jgi:methylenetetrahydrofolate dehydrogenase (NADP+)/methenyltetrahydrofolate cyclohydrolase
MSARIIDGNAVAAEIRREIAGRVKALKAEGITPGLVVVQVGDDPASAVYVRNKVKACADVGVLSENLRRPAATPEAELVDLVKRLNADP